MRKLTLLLALGCLSFISVSSASKILFLLPIAIPSHKIIFNSLIEGLASRGHEITVISPLKSGKSPNIKDIVPAPMEFVVQEIRDAFTTRREGKINFFSQMNVTHLHVVCHMMYQNAEVQELISHASFDLIIMNGLINQCVLGLVDHFKCPHILLTSLPATNNILTKVGNFQPTSFVPVPFFDFSDRMSFWERTSNMLYNFMITYSGHLLNEPESEKLYKEYLPNAKSIEEIDKGISMIFMNSHFTFTYPRPLLPNVIEVGGMHTKPSDSPLPQDLNEFISGGKDGFILFSLGSFVKESNMPEETRKVFINVFSRLKQHVLWKWETEEMPDLPSNVKLSKWLPQQNLLSNKNIKIFLTHGGLLSTQEAIYNGVPLLGIPVVGDQDLNMRQAMRLGFCLTVEILDLTEEILESAINRLLNESHFAERAKELSRIYRDQPQTSLEKAIFWTEYVIRHKGAPHLKSAAIELNYMQYHSIDVIAFLSAVALLLLWASKLLLWDLLFCKLILGLLFSSDNAKTAQMKSGKNARKKIQ